jgi:hypothetical protein
MITTLLLFFALADGMNCPEHAKHMAQGNAEHAAAVEARGDEAMGFSHHTAAHHFRLFADGGAIVATANDAEDAKTVAAIRAHLQQVAAAFAAGDFTKPQFIHGAKPDGAGTMQSLRARISYRYEELPAGARVRIGTSDAEALSAVHRFLKFQIEEHGTGDAVGVAAGER